MLGGYHVLGSILAPLKSLSPFGEKQHPPVHETHEAREVHEAHQAARALLPRRPPRLSQQSSQGPVQLSDLTPRSHASRTPNTAPRQNYSRLPRTRDSATVSTLPPNRAQRVTNVISGTIGPAAPRSELGDEMGKLPSGTFRFANTLSENRSQPRGSRGHSTYSKRQRPWSGTALFPAEPEVPPPFKRDLPGIDVRNRDTSEPARKRLKANQSSPIRHHASMESAESPSDPIEDSEDDLFGTNRAGAPPPSVKSRYFTSSNRVNNLSPPARVMNATSMGGDPGASGPELGFPSSSASGRRSAMEEAKEHTDHFKNCSESEPELLETLNVPSKQDVTECAGQVSHPIQIRDSQSQDLDILPHRERKKPRSNECYPDRRAEVRPAAATTLQLLSDNATGDGGELELVSSGRENRDGEAVRTTDASPRQGSTWATPPVPRPHFPTAVGASANKAERALPRSLALAAPTGLHQTGRIKDRMRDTQSALDHKSKGLQRRRKSSMDELSGPTNIRDHINSTRPRMSSEIRRKTGQSKIEQMVEKPDYVSDSEEEFVTQPEPRKEHLCGESTGKSQIQSSVHTKKPEHGAAPIRDQSPELEIEEKTTQLSQGLETSLSAPSTSYQERPRRDTSQRETSIKAPVQAEPQQRKHKLRDVFGTHNEHDVPGESVSHGRIRTSSRFKDKTPQYIDEDPPGVVKAKRWYDSHAGNPWKVPLTWPFEGPKQVTVQFTDLERLEEEEMLNDSLIAFELRRLEYDHPKLAKQVYFFNSYFYDALTNSAYGRVAFTYDNVKSWTRRVDLFSFPYIIVPVNSSAHWYCFIICNADKLLDQPIDLDKDDKPPEPASRKCNKPRCKDCRHLLVRDEPDDLDMQNMTLNASDRIDCTGPAVLQHSSQGSYKVPDSGDEHADAKPASLRRRGRLLDPDEPLIISLDSMGSARRNEIGVLKRYLVAEAEEKRNRVIETTSIKGIVAQGLPIQTNTYDCGVFLTGYLANFLSDPRQFVETICNREMDETYHFGDFNASRQRIRIREKLRALHKEQNARRQAAKGPKRKASDAKGIAAEGSASPVKKTKTEAPHSETASNNPPRTASKDSPSLQTLTSTSERSGDGQQIMSGPLSVGMLRQHRANGVAQTTAEETVVEPTEIADGTPGTGNAEPPTGLINLIGIEGASLGP